jgi:hypothetical protein
MRCTVRMVMSLAAIIVTGSAHAHDCPTFAGREWEFIGHLVNRVDPGPPDYESVTSGDEPVTRWYLQLAWPACFAESRQLTKIQLVLAPEEFHEFRGLLGKQVTVKGTLAEGTPGRDTTSLVVRVSSLVLYEPSRQ